MDIDHIKGLIELMVSNDLSRIEIKEGDKHILLRRGQAAMVTTLPTVHAPLSAAPAVAAPGASAAAPGSSPSPLPNNNETFIKSPMVGTFYAKPDPESPQFVNIGDTIGPHTVVCLIEAMKVFNEIKAETSGRITRLLVSNGQAVEYDQPLFAVAPA
jgi:acetyl-CoA carboxylase biotin carboxyl carrier protein